MEFKINKPYMFAFNILPELCFWKYYDHNVITLGWGKWSVEIKFDRKPKDSK